MKMEVFKIINHAQQKYGWLLHPVTLQNTFFFLYKLKIPVQISQNDLPHMNTMECNHPVTSPNYYTWFKRVLLVRYIADITPKHINTMQVLGYALTMPLQRLMFFLILYNKSSVDKDRNEVLNSNVGWVVPDTLILA
jgi:hypothetical protein